MTRIFSANVPLETNLSYAQTMRRVIQRLPEFEWIYGSYGYNGPIIRHNGYTMVPFVIGQNGLPENLEQIIQNTKPDAFFIHEDVQRCEWFKVPRNIPLIYWMPWDNEDPSFTRAAELIRSTDMVISVAKYAQQFMQQFGIPCTQVYNPVDTNVFRPDEKAGKEFKEKIGIPADHKIITWVGRPGWRKRFFHLLDIIEGVRKKMDNVHLLLHMDVNDPSLGFLPQEIFYGRGMLKDKAVIWPDDLKFDVGLPEPVLNAVYNATDVYITPHGGEGMGLPIVEAMSAGKPFIATDYTTTQEFANYPVRGKDMIGNRGIGIRPGMFFRDRGIMRPYVNIPEFIDQTVMLLQKPELCNTMGKEGRLFVMKECDCGVVASKLRNIFNKVTNVNMMGVK
jgi:glycosyltransferase involved in cell wall biosynthesis